MEGDMYNLASPTRVECMVCGEILEYNENTGKLIDHLNKQHSNSQIFKYLGKNAQNRGSLTSPENWNPKTVSCRHCGHVAPPVTLTGNGRSNRMHAWLRSLLWCYPLCFPMRKGSSTLEAFCARCGRPLGAYDAATGKLTPSKLPKQ